MIVHTSPYLEDVERASRLLQAVLRFERVLPGGEHARTCLATDGRREVVVRRFPVGDDAVAHELEVLERLAPLGDLAPHLLAAEPSPANGAIVVTNRLDGEPPGRHLTDTALGTGMAGALCRIHALPPTGLRPVPHGPPPGTGPLAVAARSRYADLDTSERVLTHHDFWSGNALWRDGTVTGVVDWSGARSGPRGVDLAWARQDLALQGRPRAAHILLEEYRRLSGVPLADIAEWDLQAAAKAEDVVGTWAPNYAGVGLHELTPDVLNERLRAWATTF